MSNVSTYCIPVYWFEKNRKWLDGFVFWRERTKNLLWVRQGGPNKWVTEFLKQQDLNDQS